MALPPSSAPGYLKALEDWNVTASQVILTLLKDEGLQEHALTQDLLSHTQEIMSAFRDNPVSSRSAMDWAAGVMQNTYAQSIREMAHISNGWHFGAFRASEAKLKDFRIEDMAEKMKKMAPELWAMLGLMLSANRMRAAPVSPLEDDGDVRMADATESTPIHVADDVDIEGTSNPNTETERASADERRRALDTIVSYAMRPIR